jgi:hypothetical protein
MQTDLQHASSAIGSAIGADAAEFTPTGEKHFIAEAALMEMGASFLFAFLKAVAKKAAEVAQEKMGKSLGTAIGDAFSGLLDRLKHKEPPVAAKDLEDARKEAEAAVKTSGLSQEEITAIGQAVATAMAAALSKRSDAEISSRVADRVKVEGLKVIAPEA